MLYCKEPQQLRLVEYGKIIEVVTKNLILVDVLDQPVLGIATCLAIIIDPHFQNTNRVSHKTTTTVNLYSDHRCSCQYEFSKEKNPHFPTVKITTLSPK